ncbi:hypothetical protein MESS2_980075 [Mesorhizobium metallidurans STM 2683]|uniref:Uncharacterized protein n=1 Tax=Mesorhizobium metallidurans STM 2683 TaxID=1297569 RepID=M5EYX7_9HYPH|nr:hypothetical protein MESS2_980075 [Mesorhizobium metallidurans STM 2683]
MHSGNCPESVAAALYSFASTRHKYVRRHRRCVGRYRFGRPKCHEYCRHLKIKTRWDRNRCPEILSEMQTGPFKSDLVRSGFARRDPEFIDLFAQNFARVAARVRWQ